MLQPRQPDPSHHTPYREDAPACWGLCCCCCLVVWVLLGPELCALGAGSCPLALLCVVPSQHAVACGAQGSGPWEPPSWAQAVELLVPLILTGRLCARMAFLAGKGRMKSASGKVFHRFYQSAQVQREATEPQRS